MLGIKKKETSDDMICALCEFSQMKEESFFCRGKEVSATGICGKFIFDPGKKKVRRFSLSEKAEELDFPPIE